MIILDLKISHFAMLWFWIPVFIHHSFIHSCLNRNYFCASSRSTADVAAAKKALVLVVSATLHWSDSQVPQNSTSLFLSFSSSGHSPDVNVFWTNLHPLVTSGIPWTPGNIAVYWSVPSLREVFLFTRYTPKCAGFRCLWLGDTLCWPNIMSTLWWWWWYSYMEPTEFKLNSFT